MVQKDITKDVNVIHLRQKQKFVKALRKLEQNRKMHFKAYDKHIPYVKPGDPLVESIKRQLEESGQPYIDPDRQSVSNYHSPSKSYSTQRSFW